MARESYLIEGKGIRTELFYDSSKGRYWIERGAQLAIHSAGGFERYRSNAAEFRKKLIKHGQISVNDSGCLVANALIVFPNRSMAASVILASSRSGNVAKRQTNNGIQTLAYPKLPILGYFLRNSVRSKSIAKTGLDVLEEAVESLKKDRQARDRHLRIVR